ncbi:MAG: type-F conjugative transfer system pilin assembly protein TrbC [Gammaproteobacteria bacterium]
MLRLLIPPLLAFVQFAHAAPDSAAAINDADQMRETMHNRTSDVLKQADELSRSPKFLNEIDKESSRLIERSDALPKTSLPDLPEPDAEQLKRARAEIGKLLDQAEQHDALTDTSNNSGSRFYVFVSFSIPDITLRRLMNQARRIGAPLVLRGMVENDMNKTRIKVGQLLDADKKGNTTIDGGLSIDPTLFERFGVSVVPSFVLTDAPVQACTQVGCPTPDFVRLAGDVTLEYVLESIAREVPAMRDDAQLLLATMKGQIP